MHQDGNHVAVSCRNCHVELTIPIEITDGYALWDQTSAEPHPSRLEGSIAVAKKNGLYVARKTATGFEVREHGGGGSNVAFDYRIVVRRRGYEAIRMAEVQHDVKIAEASRQHLAEFVSSGAPKKAAAARAPQIVTPPAI